MKKEKKNAKKKITPVSPVSKQTELSAPLAPVSPSPPQIPPSPPRKDLIDSMRGWGKSFLKQFLIFSALFLLLGLVVFFLSPSFLPRPSWSLSIHAGPLVRNSYLHISPGDQFAYRLESAGQNETRIIRALASPGCPGVLLIDLNARQAAGANADPSLYSVCLGQDGVERAADGSALGSNLSSSNLWPYAQPWMLALSDDFNWSLNATLTFQPFNITQVTSYNYRVSGRTVVSGRDAFEVHVYGRTLPSASGLPTQPFSQVNGELPLRLLVDAEERVLLLAEFSNSTLTLVDAPFMLANETNGTS